MTTLYEVRLLRAAKSRLELLCFTLSSLFFLVPHSGNMNSRSGFLCYHLGNLECVVSPLISFPTCTMIAWVPPDDPPTSHMYEEITLVILTYEVCPNTSF